MKSITTKTIVAVIFGMILLGALSTALSVAEYLKYFDTNIKDTAEMISNSLYEEIEASKLEALNYARLCADNYKIRKKVLDKNSEGLFQEFDDILKNMDVDFIIATDEKGEVIARTNDRGKKGDNLLSKEGIKRALSGNAASGIEQGNDIRLSVAAAYPVKSDEGKIIGSIYLGYDLSNNTYVDNIKKRYDVDATIFLRDERINTTIVQNGKRIIGTKLKPEIANIVLNEGKDFSGNADINNVKYFTYYKPLKGYDDKIEGILFIGKLASELNTVRNILIIKVAIFSAALIILISLVFIWWIKKSIIKPIKAASKVVDDVSKGDLTRELNINISEDEIGHIISGIISMQNNLKEILKNVKIEAEGIEGIVGNVEESIAMLNSNIEDVSATTEQVAASTQETSASAQEMAATSHEIENKVKVIVENSTEGEMAAEEILKNAENIKENFLISRKRALDIFNTNKNNLESAIENSKVIKQISSLSEAIMEITEQTNLLALNAAIEAARAGEAGKGFSIVAEEIRKLAEKSKETVIEIQNVTEKVMLAGDELAASSKQLLEFMSKDVDSDYSTMLSVAEKYSADAKYVENLVKEFNSISKELLYSIGEMSKTIDTVARASNEIADGSTNISERIIDVNSKSLEILEKMNSSKESADKLLESVNKFKI
ncbi:MAG: methyl-accepting chemotaxis protein [Caloramator sp.]|nr:methyl-accepting chemotaxis protein [Caloramator sp.]